MSSEFDISISQKDVETPALLVRLFRRIADALHRVGDRFNQIEKSISTSKFLSLPEIEKALEFGGSNQLNVANLSGILAQPQPATLTKFTATPSQSIIQTLKDNQLVLITTTPAKLQYVSSGNPTLLNDINTLPANVVQKTAQNQISNSSQFGCSIYRNAALSINNTTLTAITFDAELADTGACHDNSTNPTRITIPVGGAGRADFVAQVAFSNNATGERFAGIKKNNTTYIARNSKTGVSGDDTVLNMAVTDFIVADGDYYEFFVYQSSGGALALDVSDSGMTFFQMKKAI